MAEKYRTTPSDSPLMPPGIPYIVGNEAAERFSYYGVLAILEFFLTKHLRDASGNLAPMDPNTAYVWQHTFMAAVYAFPFVGAIVSDWLWGKYNTIIRVSLLYCVGHAILAAMDYPQLTGIEPKDVADGGSRMPCRRRRWHQTVRLGPRRRPVRKPKQAFDHQGIWLVLFCHQFWINRIDATYTVSVGGMGHGLGVWRSRDCDGNRNFRFLAGTI